MLSINLSLNIRLVVRLRRTRSSSPSATCFATPTPCRSSSKHVRDAKEKETKPRGTCMRTRRSGDLADVGEKPNHEGWHGTTRSTT